MLNLSRYIVIDTVKMEIRLSEEKIEAAKEASCILEGKEGLHTEGTRVPDQIPSTCCKGSTPWEGLSEACSPCFKEPESPIISSELTAP